MASQMSWASARRVWAVAMLAVGLVIVPLHSAPAEEAPPATVTVTPATGLVDGGEVTVHWVGFQPGNPVVITQCVAGAVVRGNRGECLWASQQVAPTDVNGTGTASFRVVAGVISNPFQVNDQRAAQALHVAVAKDPNSIMGLTSVTCDEDHPCEIAVTHAMMTLPPEMSAAAAVAFPGIKASGFPRRLPPPVVDTPEPPPVPSPALQPLELLTGYGDSGYASLVTSWAGLLAGGKESVEIDYTAAGGPRTAKEQLLEGVTSDFRRGSHFALVGSEIKFTSEEQQKLGDGRLLYAPVVLGAVGVGYQIRYEGAWRACTERGTPCEIDVENEAGQWIEGWGPDAKERFFTQAPLLRVTPAWLTEVFGHAAVRPGEATGWQAPESLERNGRVHPDFVTQQWSGQVRPVGAASEHRTVTSWMAAASPTAWERTFADGARPDVVYPDYRNKATVEGDKGAQSDGDVANILTNPQEWIEDKTGQEDAWAGEMKAIGYLTTGAAHMNNVPLAYLQNGAGNFVQPTSSAILASLGAATTKINADNIVDFNPLTRDPGAYPMAQVYYVAYPSKGLPAAKRAALSRMLKYMVSDEGQQVAAQNGAVPLTSNASSGELKDRTLVAAEFLAAAKDGENLAPRSEAPSTGDDKDDDDKDNKAGTPAAQKDAKTAGSAEVDEDHLGDDEGDDEGMVGFDFGDEDSDLLALTDEPIDEGADSADGDMETANPIKRVARWAGGLVPAAQTVIPVTFAALLGVLAVGAGVAARVRLHERSAAGTDAPTSHGYDLQAFVKQVRGRMRPRRKSPNPGEGLG